MLDFISTADAAKLTLILLFISWITLLGFGALFYRRIERGAGVRVSSNANESKLTKITPEMHNDDLIFVRRIITRNDRNRDVEFDLVRDMSTGKEFFIGPNGGIVER